MLRLKRLSWVLRDVWFHLKHIGKSSITLYFFILLRRDFMSLSRRHRTAWYVIPSLVRQPAKFTFGLFNSKVTLLLGPVPSLAPDDE